MRACANIGTAVDCCAAAQPRPAPLLARCYSHLVLHVREADTWTPALALPTAFPSTSCYLLAASKCISCSIVLIALLASGITKGTASEHACPETWLCIRICHGGHRHTNKRPTCHRRVRNPIYGATSQSASYQW